MTKFIKSKWRVSLVLMSLDVISLIGIFFLLVFIRHGGEFPWGNPFPLMLLPVGCIFSSIYVINGYSIKTDLISLDYAFEHALSCLIAMVFTIVTIYSFQLMPAQQFSRGVLPVSFVFFYFLSLFYRRLFYEKMTKHFGQRYFLILGSGELAEKVYLSCQNVKVKHSFRIAGLNGANTGKPIHGDGSPIIQGDLIKELKSFGDQIDAVIMAEDRRGLKNEVLEKLIYCHFQDIPVYSVEEFYEHYFNKISYDVVQPHILLRGGFHLARDIDFERFKRITDITISSLGLIASIPFFLIVPILIKWDSQGPVIFKQERVGKNNRPFIALKFRTMHFTPNDKGDMYTRENDKRVTRLGKWLRFLRIDELPQLINVLKGEMSLIGPRAEWVKLTQIYEKEIQCYDIRHLVKPGITGWAQVNFPYGTNVQDAITKFEFDLYYVRNYSLKLDCMIILKTFYTVLFRKGQ
jgi:exopolysaccharide biosynthesis polyprenyl glycosylphosphotransferase